MTAEVIDITGLLDINQAVSRSGRSEATIRRLVRAGRLPVAWCVRDGRRKKLIDPLDLDRVLAPVVGSGNNNSGGGEEDLDAVIDAFVASAPRLSADQRARIAAAFA